MLGTMKWLLLVLGVCTNASASVLVKVAMTAPRTFPTFSDPMAALQNWPFWLGLTLYGSAFLLYAATLARLPLSVAHPILTSGAIAVVAIVSFSFLNEPFRWSTALGITLVAIGVGLIASQAG